MSAAAGGPNWLDRAIRAVSPGLAVARARNRQVLMHYDAAQAGNRLSLRRVSGSDADAANAARGRLAALSRDMIRNTPLAARAQQVIANNVVGDGIIPRLSGLPKALSDRGLARIEEMLDTTAIDARGQLNLYGLQRLVMNAVVDSGEALVVRRAIGPGILQVEVLEPDYLDTVRLQGSRPGHWVQDGIEYDARNRRFGYWLYDEHPGAALNLRSTGLESRFWPAEQVAHVYRLDRPGQERGVTWFAPLMLTLQDLGDFTDAQLVRQKIAACFVAFRRTSSPGDAGAARELSELRPGLIQDIGPEDEIEFGAPPGAGDYDPFVRSVLRSVAAGLGVTYEALTGDLSTVNFSSARMGRIEMDRNVSSWQWTMLVPQMLDPIGRWFRRAWAMDERAGQDAVMMARLGWVPPHRVLVDPTREIPALTEAVQAGFTSWSDVVRSQGHDPERLLEQIAEDNRRADAAGLRFASDYRHFKGAAAPGGAVRQDDDAAPARRPGQEDA